MACDARKITTYHFILILNEKLDSFNGCSTCFGDGLIANKSELVKKRNQEKHTAETPPIRKSTARMSQVSTKNATSDKQ
jgi:hypothetical protein